MEGGTRNAILFCFTNCQLAILYCFICLFNGYDPVFLVDVGLFGDKGTYIASDRLKLVAVQCCRDLSALGILVAISRVLPRIF